MAKKVKAAKSASKSTKSGAKWGGIGSDAVKKATGRGWDEWCKVLDKDGARTMSHKDIAVLVAEKHGVRPWWSQMVTVGYEQARGLRVKYQVVGGYSASVSRTFPVTLKEAFTAVADAKRRQKWLKDELKVTTATPHKSVRIAWNDGTRVAIGFYDKTGKSGPRTQLAFQHEKLTSAAAVGKSKKFWAERSDALARALGV